MKTLKEIVQENPFDDFKDWWPVGRHFSRFMSNAIHGEWVKLPGSSGDLSTVKSHVNLYLSTVFDTESRSSLVDEFAQNNLLSGLQSGQFDALSYAYYRSTFEIIKANLDEYENSLERERRLYTKRVGKLFFDQVAEHLALDLPADLLTEADLAQMKTCITQVGQFLSDEGYLRDHFAFHFNVEIEHMGASISQNDGDILGLIQSGTGHALYEMGYPIILPSAVYLYHTMEEAQHHSSRTIEELFDRVGFDARETDDFDPIGYPSDRVVELWEIKRKPLESGM
ncbi:MAG: hypothetical protein AAF902_26780 [Chloroflexota bacterium]